MSGFIISQDKDISGKLTKASVDDAVSKFKKLQCNLSNPINYPIRGFELNGGDGMTRGGKKSWDEFTKWCDEENLQCEYNSKADLLKIRDKLRNRVDSMMIPAT